MPWNADTRYGVVGQAFSLRGASAPLRTAPVETGAQTESLPHHAGRDPRSFHHCGVHGPPVMERAVLATTRSASLPNQQSEL